MVCRTPDAVVPALAPLTLAWTCVAPVVMGNQVVSRASLYDGTSLESSSEDLIVTLCLVHDAGSRGGGGAHGALLIFKCSTLFWRGPVKRHYTMIYTLPSSDDVMSW